MAVTVVATVGDPAANSYATVTAANAYANNRVGAAAAAWFASIDNDAKGRALITATRDIDSIPSTEVDFVGERATDTQALEFPRDDDPLALPQRLIDATIELAIAYFSSSTTADVLNPIVNNKKRVEADGASVEYFAPADTDALSIDRFPWIVRRLLGPLLVWLIPASNWGGGVAIRAS